MTPEQFEKLLDVLNQLATRSYTISGAADWPMLIAIGTVLLGAIGVMWADLRSKLTDGATDNDREHDKIWAAMAACQADCCPRRHERARD